MRTVFIAVVDGEFSAQVEFRSSPKPECEGLIAWPSEGPNLWKLDEFVKRFSLYRGREVAALGFGFARATLMQRGPTTFNAVWMPL
jgi:hypothetical protein